MTKLQERAFWGEKELSLVLKTEPVWVSSSISDVLCRSDSQSQSSNTCLQKDNSSHEIGDHDLRL